MFRRIIVTAAAAASLCAPALAADFAVDTNHTQAEFTVVHLGFSHVRGQIPITGGAVSAADNGLPSAIAVTLSAKDIDSHSADRDRDLRGGDWLDVEKFPVMTFVSRQISGTPDSFTVIGDLTMHGVTKPVTLAAKEEGKMTDGRGRTHFAYSASTTIDRRNWGLNWGHTTPAGALIAGNDVTIGLTLETVAKQ